MRAAVTRTRKLRAQENGRFVPSKARLLDYCLRGIRFDGEFVEQCREVLVGDPYFAVDLVVSLAQRHDLVVVAESYRLTIV